MVVYCIDTSALIAAWQERYPPENFPRVWERFDDLIECGRMVSPIEVLHETSKRSDELHGWLKACGRMVSPIEVLHETSKRSDELHGWLKARSEMFRELEDPIQVEVAKVLACYPRLVGEKKLRTSADPFVIALARVDNLQIVTDEKPTSNLNRPNIPDVCTDMGMAGTMNLLQLIQAEKWVVG